MADFGEKVLLHCVGTLDDGTVVVDTKAAGRPLEVTIGASMLPAAVEVAASNLLPGLANTMIHSFNGFPQMFFRMLLDYRQGNAS